MKRLYMLFLGLLALCLSFNSLSAQAPQTAPVLAELYAPSVSVEPGKPKYKAQKTKRNKPKRDRSDFLKILITWPYFMSVMFVFIGLPVGLIDGIVELWRLAIYLAPLLLATLARGLRSVFDFGRDEELFLFHLPFVLFGLSMMLTGLLLPLAWLFWAGLGLTVLTGLLFVVFARLVSRKMYKAL